MVQGHARLCRTLVDMFVFGEAHSISGQRLAILDIEHHKTHIVWLTVTSSSLMKTSFFIIFVFFKEPGHNRRGSGRECRGRRVKMLFCNVFEF